MLRSEGQSQGETKCTVLAATCRLMVCRWWASS